VIALYIQATISIHACIYAATTNRGTSTRQQLLLLAIRLLPYLESHENVVLARKLGSSNVLPRNAAIDGDALLSG
jgi:hypothetical protein